MQKTVAEINLKAIADNARAFRSLTGKKLYAVVKADAYGHGAEAVTCALSGVADGFAVALIDEAVAIGSAACGRDILVLTPPVDKEQIVALAQCGFIATLPDLRTAALAAEVCGRRGLVLRAHVKVNTGMNRYGASANALGRMCDYLCDTPCVSIEGLYSHLYARSSAECEAQRVLFLRAREIFGRYFANAVCHLSATYGSLLGEEYAFDAVRVGMGLYGYYPDDTDEKLCRKADLRRAMKVYATAIESRRYSFGGVGYGSPDEERVARLAHNPRLTVYRAGYADGFRRELANGMHGAEKNLAPLCMDACIRLGDGAGARGRQRRTLLLSDAAEVARREGRIVYDVLCSVTRRAEFRYVYR